MANQEEEVLGKAYDARLMRRLLTYLRPYTWQVTVALIAIILKAILDVLGPFLTKTAIDKYLALIGPGEAAQDVQQRRLACPVRPDDADNLAGRNRERHGAKRCQPAEADTHVADLEN